MEKTSFDLGEKEAALIFKEDMTIELILPNIGDEEEIAFEEHQNMFVAMAITAASDDEVFRAVISKKLEEMLGTVDDDEETETETADVPRCSCGPEDCSCEEC